MPIVPETKDWTFVLETACPECGFDTRKVAGSDVAGLVRENAASWPRLLARPNVHRRPNDSTWSPLEYACHVRDVFRIFARRLHLMLTEDDPLFPNWDQDAAALIGRYGEQDPGKVADELVADGEQVAAAFDNVRDDQWARPGRRSDGASFTVETLARYFAHDPIHHVYDVTR